MRLRTIGLLTLTLLTLALAGAGGATAEDRPRAPRWRPPPDTIVAVDGDADLGFTIHHYDGSTLSPPTLSESTAECSEYDTDVQVAVCQAETETWFRDLADLQTALAWARYDARVSPQRPPRPGSGPPAPGRR